MTFRDSRKTGSGSIWIRTLVATAALSNLSFDRNVALAIEPVDPIRAPESKYALKDLDGHFPFAVPESKEAWESRAKDLCVRTGQRPVVAACGRPEGGSSRPSPRGCGSGA